MRVRLTRRLAESIDGIDLSRRSVGDLIDLSQPDAKVLMAEGWATLADEEPANDAHPGMRARAGNGSARRKHGRRG